MKTIQTEQPLSTVNFYSDGHTLLAGGMYGGLFIYDLRKHHKPKERLIGHDTAIKHIEFHCEKEPSRSEHNIGSRVSRSGVSSTHKLNGK